MTNCSSRGCWNRDQMVRLKDHKPWQAENEALNISVLQFNTEYSDERQKVLLAIFLFPTPLVLSSVL